MIDVACSLVGLKREDIVRLDPRYYRPTEVDVLLGDIKKVKDELGWEPQVKFQALIRIMLAADMKKEGLAVPFEVPPDPLEWRKPFASTP